MKIRRRISSTSPRWTKGDRRQRATRRALASQPQPHPTARPPRPRVRPARRHGHAWPRAGGRALAGGLVLLARWGLPRLLLKERRGEPPRQPPPPRLGPGNAREYLYLVEPENPR